MSSCPTVRIKVDYDWTPYVVINAEDFDPEKHERFDDPADDAGSMKVVDLKAALDAKGVEYPANAKKADLQALLDSVQG